MKVRLPTRLLVLRQWQNSGVNGLLGAVTEEEEVDLPAHLRDTEGHGNNVTHAKPVEYTNLVQWEDSPFIRPDMINHINRNDYFYSGSLPPADVRRGSRGSRRCLYYEYQDMPNSIRYGSATVGWTCVSGPTDPRGLLFNWTYRHDYHIETDHVIRNNGWSYHRDSYHNYYDVYESGGVPDVDLSPGSVYASRDYSQRARGYLKGTYDKRLPKAPLLFFDFGEYPHTWDAGPRSSFSERIMTAAFTQAFNQVPQYADNNIANMVEIGSLCKDLLTADPKALNTWGKLAKNYADDVKRGLSVRKIRGKYLRDAWMTYRYTYSTTSSDVRQAIDTASRRTVTYLKPLRFDGNARLPNPFQEGEVSCHVQFNIVLNAKDVLHNMHHYMQMYGVSLSAYKLWDLVPFSFVADWFFDIGGMLERQERESSINDYLFSDFWWSLKYYSKDELSTYRCYNRWSEYFVPEHLAREYNRSSSSTTWLKRIADGYCLTHK